MLFLFFLLIKGTKLKNFNLLGLNHKLLKNFFLRKKLFNFSFDFKKNLKSKKKDLLNLKSEKILKKLKKRREAFLEIKLVLFFKFIKDKKYFRFFIKLKNRNFLDLKKKLSLLALGKKKQHKK
jgi:hypothetical protein